MTRLGEQRTIDTIATVAMPFVALLAALATALLTGCGDNLCAGPACGAGADGGPAVPFVASSIRFVPDEGAGPGAINLRLAGVDLEQNRFALRLAGDGIDAFGVAGRLTLDGSVARIDGATAGSGLGGDGVTVNAAAAATPTGALLGFSRAGDKTDARLTPARGIGKLHFTALRPGTTRIEWAEGRARVLDAALQPVEARWLGGTLIVE
jgi:hypothetical protein